MDPCRSRHKQSAIPVSRPRYVHLGFLAFAIFVVLPFFDVPFIGLSITAPLVIPLLAYSFFGACYPKPGSLLIWTVLASAIFAGIIASFLANSPLFQDREISALEGLYLVRYAFWLLVFIATALVAANHALMRQLPRLLGSAVVLLAIARIIEAVAFGKVGAWTNTSLTTQNTYGILFSTFTPMLFYGLVLPVWRARLLAASALVLVAVACALNGSRGSWICVGFSLAVYFLVILASKPSRSFGLLALIALVAGALVALLLANPKAMSSVLSRSSTFDNLEMDKSYMIRDVLNQRSIRLFQLSPVWGIGPGRYREVYVPLEMPTVFKGRPDHEFMNKSSHNSYLGFLAEGGLVATAPFALLLVVLAGNGIWAAIVLNRQGAVWAPTIIASFAGMSLHLWALAGLTGTHPWFVYGLVVATIYLSTRRRSTPARMGPPSLRIKSTAVPQPE